MKTIDKLRKLQRELHIHEFDKHLIIEILDILEDVVLTNSHQSNQLEKINKRTKKDIVFGSAGRNK